MELHQRTRGKGGNGSGDEAEPILTPAAVGQAAVAPVGSSSTPSWSGDSGSRETWRQWAESGVRRRSCKVICSLVLVAFLCGVVLLYMYASAYSWLHSKDPCVVSVETSHYLRNYPRVSRALPQYKPVLPKIIHQQWKTDKVPEGVFTKWHLKFKDLFPEPEFKHVLWTDATARELIAKEFPFFLKTYDSYEFGIQRADAARYFILYRYGGLYADLDYEPLTNFWQHLPTDRVGFVESPYLFNEKTQNSLMSSPIGDPFWNMTFELLMERSKMPVLLATGPMFLDVLIKKATETFHVLPCENFQRLPFSVAADDDHSPFLSKLHREIFGRLMPMKYCGDYHKAECQYGKHHNTVSYIKDTGIWKMAFGR